MNATPSEQNFTLVDDDNLTITMEPGETGLAVVSFTGIGHRMGELQRAEFRRTLASDDKQNTVYYVIDRKRRWFNHGLRKRISDIINASLSQEGPDAVATIGNSMGGSGALMLAARLERCTRALAFVPQMSVHPQLATWERRWKKFRRHITDWDALAVLPFLDPSTVQYTCVVGNQVRADQKHVSCICSVIGTDRVIVVEGGDHQVASSLRGRGLLTPLVHSFLDGDDPMSGNWQHPHQVGRKGRTPASPNRAG